METEMPEAVREARAAIGGMAGFALAYPVIMGLTCGEDAAAAACGQFCVAWALGLLVLGFAEGARGVRTLTMALAVAQALVGWRVIGDLGTMPPAVGIVTASYSLGTAVAIVHLLHRPEAKIWFGVRDS